ncbi:hypothetical protein DCAR_0519895 [Daucus carota subsp. sativus]|uniref:Replication protein A 70 kDa DNA-binding subunit B/D first OB fold domain-containing protein n=1 Tax=Daucus carota subsp. sativus TaxID=79200 RepID=A0A161YL11_DAUCS|nr:hypothetical protein DCAR_0519895 [Daucus carota subsp. sativus]
MSTKKYDSFKDLRKGKYDWKVLARALNSWKGYTKTREAFKGYNILLLDHKRARIHASVPAKLEEEVDKLVDLGKIYLIQNFTVKNYQPDDKYRFELHTLASDETGQMTIILEDREVRRLIGKTALDLIEEGNKVEIFPIILDNLKNKFYSIKLLIKEANTKYKVDAFLATDIIEGSYTEIKQETERNYPQPIQSLKTHHSESSYHLDSAN